MTHTDASRARVRIRPGATIFHDHRPYVWPDHAGADFTKCLCRLTFKAEKSYGGKLNLIRRGFGLRGAYGAGAIIINAEDLLP